MENVKPHTPPAYRTARVLDAAEGVPGYFDLLVQEPDIAATALPGQFVMVRGWPGTDPLLPRPFDVMQVRREDGSLRLFIKVEGRGTGLMRTLEPGDAVQLAGPMGRGIDRLEFSSVALLARGAGAAAVVYLAEAAAARGIEVFTLLSASSAPRLVCRGYLEPVSRELRVATDDGSAGYHGNATDLLDELLARRPVDRVYTCGSKRFARHVQRLDGEGKVEGYVFLEGLMACGMGDCHGCAVSRAGGPGYLLVCMDGPHFRASEVVIA